MLIWIFIFLLGNVSASYIYGDIYIEDDGRAIFSVNSDIELDLGGLTFNENRITGETKELVSLENGVWSFLLDLGYYDTILVDVHLSENMQNLLSLEGVNFFIGFDEKTISFIDGEIEFFILMEYELDYTPSYGFLYFLGTLVVIFFVFALLAKFNKRKEKKLKGVFPFVNDKEKAILELLMKKSRRQKEVRKKLKIPKASYSRYLVNLEKKKLIIREGEGKNKILKLK